MHQLKVFRCDVCHAPFLFESSLEDHKKEHAPKDVSSAPLEKSSNSVDKNLRKGARAKRKQKSA